MKEKLVQLDILHDLWTDVASLHKGLGEIDNPSFIRFVYLQYVRGT
jgi:hypothetical protein